MPETIDFELALGITASLVSVIGLLIIALSHMYAQLIRKDIRNINDKLDKIGNSTNDCHDRITDHVEEFHTIKG